MNDISAGRLLRANTRGCVVGCRISQTTPAFGSMIYIPTETGRIYGLVSDIHIDDDGLVRQLATAGDVPEEIIQDNRVNRNVPVEMSVLFIGTAAGGEISYMLPSRPPLSLDKMYVCNPKEICIFTDTGQFGYFRHILNFEDAPIGDLLSSHLHEANAAHCKTGNSDWINQAITEIIVLLRNDHERMTQILGAVSDAFRGTKRK